MGPQYGLRNNYDKMVVYPLAGRAFTGGLSKFERLGIKVDYSQNVKFMQVPVVGSGEFVREWVEYKMGIIKRVFAGLRGLSKRQVALYLLRRAGHGCRVLYYLRTTPRDLIPHFVQCFDEEMRGALEDILGLVLDDAQWEQASLPTRSSGLGLCRASDVADIAYIASRHTTFADCRALDASHVWDDGTVRGDGTPDVIQFLNGFVVAGPVSMQLCLNIGG